MYSLLSTLNPRLLVVLVAALIVLMLLIVLFLLSAHLGTVHMFVQSTEAVLD